VLITRGATKRLASIGISREAATGVVIIIRVVFFIIATILVVNAFGPDVAALVSVSTLFGTALGLAFSQAVSGIVNGLYILIARPFRVGDYVRIGDSEGIVREITLNYTRILQSDESQLRIPNTKVVDSKITNFRANMEDVIQDVARDRLATSDTSLRHTLTNALIRLKRFASHDVVYRYSFDITTHFTVNHTLAKKHFIARCQKWENIFLVKPEWQVWNSHPTGITYRFTIVVSNPEDLIKYIGNFMDDLLMVYTEEIGAHPEIELESPFPIQELEDEKRDEEEILEKLRSD
jgi:small-conductance mechanosensitive channel